MKKTIIRSAGMILTALTLNASAQTAPDFTLNDVNGNPHTLYDQLNAGKAVVLDVFAIWCSPCWDLHQTHLLENMYVAQGPTGTDKIRVFQIDGDNAPVNVIQGGQGSMGDWTSGVTYPTLQQGGNMATAYNVPYFPAIYLVCPDKSYSEVTAWPLTQAAVQAKIDACPVATGIDQNLNFEKMVSVYPSPSTGIVTVEMPQKSNIRVYNMLGGLVKEVQATALKYQLDLTDLENANYFIEIESEGKIARDKIVIVK
jgi:thiol-disulfide isomerase/thioredoxin